MNIEKHVRQLLLLVRTTVSLRRLVKNRVTITLLAVVIGIAMIQGYVMVGGGGQIEGTVVDTEGESIENAAVEIERIDLRVTRTVNETTTDENGYFSMQNDNAIEFYVTVDHDEYESERVRHHRYFSSQDVEIRIVMEST